MSQDQLRQLSDLQLSERELADVIEAIHTGNTDADVQHGDSSNSNAGPHPEQQCVLCQAVEPVSREDCMICQGGGSSAQVQQQLQRFADWVLWYKQNQHWASQHQHLSTT